MPDRYTNHRGGAINKELEAEVRTLPNIVYSTYGMTETLSHIALRRLNGPLRLLLPTPLSLPYYCLYRLRIHSLSTHRWFATKH